MPAVEQDKIPAQTRGEIEVVGRHDNRQVVLAIQSLE
jgi:hypothetical protein